MRGTHLPHPRSTAPDRIIPAHAGNSRRLGSALFMSRGSSPRMRGTHVVSALVVHVTRIIPAHAGNSLTVTNWTRWQSDHPRACGELSVQFPDSIGRSDHPRACGELPEFGSVWQPCPVGSSPRMRGTLLHCPGSSSRTCAAGSSPRMRGTRIRQYPRMLSPRIIPAHAGNSWNRSPIPTIARIIPAHAGNSSATVPSRICPPDHPRACGELAIDDAWLLEPFGSSPRMRGTPRHRGDAIRCIRIIPAHAGNSACSGGSLAYGLPDHPRACGELLNSSRTHRPQLRIIPAHAGNSGRQTTAPSQASGSSPRMRGTLRIWFCSWASTRIIPAHAGNSQMGSDHHAGNLRNCPDHPRACGELVVEDSVHSRKRVGSSPRMRGTLRGCFAEIRRLPSDHPRACGELPPDEIARKVKARIIPAHAGNSSSDRWR